MSSYTGDIHESLQGTQRAGTITVTVLATLFVGLRFCCRWQKGLHIGIDDYTLLVALGFLFIDGAINLAMIHYGMGLHASTVPAENLEIVFKLLMAFECTYSTTLGIIKISILLMYRRIFPTRGFKIAGIVLGLISVAWVIAIVGVSVFQCTPIARAWDQSVPGTCINLRDSFIGNAIPNILTDVAILAVPVKMVWGLHANLVQRLSVIMMFLLGSFVIFTSIYRFTTVLQFQPADTTWTLAKACTWCVVECAMGIISACLPTMRPLFALASSRFNTTNGTSENPSKVHTTLGSRTGLRFQRLTSDAKFRPAQEQLGDVKAQAVVNHPDDSSDDVPLNRIMVRQDMTWEREDTSRR